MTLAWTIPAPLPKATPAPAPAQGGFAARRKALGLGSPVTESSRICGLPQVFYDGADLTAELALPGALPFEDPSGAIIRALKPDQSASLAAIRDAQGAIIGVGVGGGKAGVALLAGTVLEGVRCAIILTPATTVPQLTATFAAWRQRFRLVPTVRILSYHTLSQPRKEHETPLLEELAKGFSDREVVLVADEAHRLKAATAARTQRVARYFESHPGVRFIALSGTLTTHSLHDFAHLSDWALRHQTPIPRDRATLDAWAACCDESGQPEPLHWEQMHGLWDWAGVPHNLRGKERRTRTREAFRDRLRSAPGVHFSKVPSIGCSLVIQALEAPPIPATVLDLMATSSQGLDPDGQPYANPTADWQVDRHLSLGFFYRWRWPRGCSFCGQQEGSWSRTCPATGMVHDVVEPIKDHDWLDARGRWAGAVRYTLQQEARHGYDSAALIEAQVRSNPSHPLRKHLDRWDAEAVKRWSGRPEPPVDPVWVDYWLIDHAVAWARRQPSPVLVWYHSTAVRDALARAGLKVYYGGEAPDVSKAHTCAVSSLAHSEGLNLQKWHTNLVLEPSPGGAVWEQLLGRTHRAGQAADEVNVYVYQHTEAFRDAMHKARINAREIEEKTGDPKRLNMATYSL